MHNKISVALLIIILVSTLTSCYSLKNVELRKVENVQIKNTDFSNMQLEVTAHIFNPNKVGFKIKNVDLDVSAGRGKLGKATLCKKLKIKANSDQSYTLLINVKPDATGLLTGAGAALGLLSKGSANVNFKGTITGGKWLFFNKKFEVNSTERVGR
jgi:LEA14-like dessication related protein